MTTLDISSIVQVKASIAPRGAARRDFGRTLLVTTDPTLEPGGTRVLSFARMGEVADTFGPGTTPYQAAQVYFSQSPYPRYLLVGRWAKQAQKSVLVGGTPGTLAELQALTTATLTWQGATTGNLDFSGDTSFADVAEAVETALRATSEDSLDDATVEYSGGVFRVTLGLDSEDVPYAIDGFVADASGTAASLLGLAATSGAVIDPGYPAEGIAEAMNAIEAVDGGFYFVATDFAGDDDLLALAQWVAARPHMAALDVSGEDVLGAGETGSLAAQLSALELDRAFLVWSRMRDHKALSLAGRMSSVDFEGASTLVTAKFKSLPGTTPDILNSNAKRELDRKRINYYTWFGSDAIVAEGTTLQPGTWIDVRYWLDWIVDGIQTGVYNLLRTHPSRLPQTEVGLASIKSEIERVCDLGVQNGGIAPGAVSEAQAHDIRQATGNRSFDGFLSQGYLVHAGAFAEMSPSDRAMRQSPPFKVWLKGSGAIHFADILLVLEG